LGSYSDGFISPGKFATKTPRHEKVALEKDLTDIGKMNFMLKKLIIIITTNPYFLVLCVFPPDHAIRAGEFWWLVN